MPQQHSKPELPATQKITLPRHHILILDDSRSAVYVLGKLLEAMGQDVKTIDDPLAALEIVQTEHPDIMISDIAMPGMNGYELAHRIRQGLGLQDIVLVALTGYGQDSDKERAVEAGFDYHLTKPVSIDALQTLLASLPLPRAIASPACAIDGEAVGRDDR